VGDRERGAILIALSLGLLVVSGADLDLGSWRSRVELVLAATGVAVGLGLILLGRRR
jgi:hypothetical protein